MANSATTAWIRGSLSVAAVAVGGYVVYKLFTRPRQLPPAIPDTKEATPGGPKVVILRMPKVAKGENLSTKTQLRVTAKNPAYRYVKVQRQYEQGGATVYDFKSPINGFFTDHLLSQNGQLWAEIRPS